MSDESLSDPVAEGFREAPRIATQACAVYMGRIIEVRSLVAAFFSSVKSLQALAETVPAELDKIPAPKGGMFALVEYKYSRHRQLVNEILLSRAVESFDLYVLNVLMEIFREKPELLKSESPIDAATILDLRSLDDVVFFLAERKLQELSFKPLVELRKYIVSRTNIDLFSSDQIYEAVHVASELRNLIAHNDCKPNDLFKRRIGKSFDSLAISETGKVVINDDWLRRTSYTLDGVVFDFDKASASKFMLPLRSCP